MNIFISWSGETSMKIAEELKKWLPKIIQSAKPYYTPSDIEKGARWDSEINKKLSECLIGLICLTKDNTEKPWILFEAGALSNRLDKSKVCPILFGLKKSEITGPLAGIQLTEFNKGDLLKLLQTINTSLEVNAIDDNLLREMFDAFYPKLEENVNNILSNQRTPSLKPQRSEKDILEEILDLVRKQNNATIPKFVSKLSPMGNTYGSLAIGTNETMLTIGEKLVHKKYGSGEVIGISNSESGDIQYTVTFEDGRTIKLLEKSGFITNMIE